MAETIEELQAKLDKQLTVNQNLNGKLTDLEKRFEGVDIEALKKAKIERDELARINAAGDPAKIEAEINRARSEIETELRNTYGKTQAEKEAELARVNGELRSLKVVNPLISEAAKYFKPDAIPYIQKDIEVAFDLSEDGKHIVKGATGKPEFSKKDPTKLMTAHEWFEAKALEFPSGALPTAKTGSGSSNEKVQGGAKSGLTYEDLKKMPDGGKAALAAMDPKERSQIVFTRK